MVETLKPWSIDKRAVGTDWFIKVGLGAFYNEVVGSRGGKGHGRESERCWHDRERRQIPIS